MGIIKDAGGVEFITSADYPAIRALINPALDDDELSDTVIGDESYLLAAELEVLDWLPTAGDKIGNDKIRVRNIIKSLTASRLVIAIPEITTLKAGNELSYGYKVMGASEKAQMLRDSAVESMQVLLSTGGIESVTMFSTVEPCF